MITSLDFFTQAEYLVNSKPNVTETDCRSALSRGYYSLFHDAHQNLSKNHKNIILTKIYQDLDKRKITGFTRTRVENLELSYLSKLGVNYHQILSKVLNQLKVSVSLDFKAARDDRNFADYELKMLFPQNETKQKLNEIKTTMRAIKNL